MELSYLDGVWHLEFWMEYDWEYPHSYKWREWIVSMVKTVQNATFTIFKTLNTHISKCMFEKYIECHVTCFHNDVCQVKWWCVLQKCRKSGQSVKGWFINSEEFLSDSVDIWVSPPEPKDAYEHPVIMLWIPISQTCQQDISFPWRNGRPCLDSGFNILTFLPLIKNKTFIRY